MKRKKNIKIWHSMHVLRNRHAIVILCLIAMLFPFKSIKGEVANSSSETLEVVDKKGNLIRGIVTDGRGEPLVGVNIRVPGSMIGVSSDIEGRFAITLPSGSNELVFNYIGFSEVRQKIKNANEELKIVMKEDIASLEEVVVVGFGEQKKVAVTSAVSTIKGDQLTANTPNLINSMSGRIAGILAIQNTGEPGKNDSEFYIRGMSTFGGFNSPLILVDGVPSRSMTELDPDEIESFNIYKDASATAMYGAEGANGVIVITTKRGKSEKTKISYRGEAGFNKPIRLPDFMNAGEIMRAYNDYLIHDGLERMFSDERINLHETQADPDLYPDVDWYDLLRKNTFSTRHTITFRGGGQKHRFFISGGYRQDDGLYKNTNLDYNNNLKYERYNIRSNVDLDITPSTQLKINISGQHAQRNEPGHSSDAIFTSFSQTPPHLFPMIYSDGTVAAHPGGKGSVFRVNPYNLIRESGYSKIYETKIQADFEIRQDLSFLTKGLRASIKVGFDNETIKALGRGRTPAQFYAKDRDEDGLLVFDQIVEEVPFGTLSGSFTREYRNIYSEVKLQYDRTFADVHSVGGYFLYNRSDNQGNKNNYNDVLPFRKESVVGKGSYVYDRRYSLDLTFAVTGSEQFAKGNRYGFFPAAGFAWNFAEEAFFPWKEYVPEFKVRASIGLTGNDRISSSRFLFKETWTEAAGGYSSGWVEGGSKNIGAPSGVLYEGRIAAPELKWEEELKRNIGVDLSLLKGQLSINLDYFNNKREDILLRRNTVSSVTGFRQNPFQNFGQVKNQGFEVSLKGESKFGDVRLSYLGNFTYTKNKIIERDEVLQPYDYMNQTGKELNTFSVLQAERLYDINDFTITSDAKGNPIYKLVEGLPTPMVGLNTPKPGDIKYVDRNNDGVINNYDYGRDLTKPKFPRGVYGFGLSADYKGLYASVFFQGAFDVSVNIADNGRFYPFSPSLDESAAYSAVLDRWSQESPRQDVLFPRISKVGRDHNTRTSTWWMRDGSFLRFKDVEIGYEFDKKLVRKLNLERLKVYLQGHNLHTWDNIKFWDPEQRSSDSGMKYPITKQFTFGIEVTI